MTAISQAVQSANVCSRCPNHDRSRARRTDRTRLCAKDRCVRVLILRTPTADMISASGGSASRAGWYTRAQAPSGEQQAAPGGGSRKVDRRYRAKSAAISDASTQQLKSQAQTSFSRRFRQPVQAAVDPVWWVRLARWAVSVFQALPGRLARQRRASTGCRHWGYSEWTERA